MKKPFDYHTLQGYARLENRGITNAMEDYLEMITRLSQDGGPIRIKLLSDCLNVHPSSASKMADNLKAQGLIRFERYGVIELTEDGRRLGEYYIFRHDCIHRFLCFLNKTKEELEETEKIEHFLSPRTVFNMEKFLKSVKKPME